MTDLDTVALAEAEDMVKRAKDILKGVRDRRANSATARNAAICVTELEGVQYRLKDALGFVGSPRQRAEG